MPHLAAIRASVVAAMLALCAPAAAQDGAGPPPVVRSPILTVESERLFGESAFGQRMISDIEAEGQALAAENRALEAELTAEEQRLTRLRESTDPAEFREMADAFDSRVQRLRQEQDAKARALTMRDDAARRRFFSAAQPVLADILREAGAALILERSNVLLSANAIDVTDAAIARVDAAIGDGSGLAAPEAPTPAPAPRNGGAAPDDSLFDMGEGAASDPDTPDGTDR